MARKRINPKDFNKAIEEILEDYGDNVTAAMKKAVTLIAKNAKNEIQSTSPVRSGAYKKGWAFRKTDSRFGIDAVIHNRTRYQLTHLLEKGHAKRGGGRVNPVVHIAPVEERAVEAVRKAVEKIAGEG